MMQNIQDHFQIIVLHAFLFNLMPFVSCLSLLRSWTNLYHWHLIFCFPVSLNLQAAHLCRPTWIALGHSIDVGGAEHANTCPSPILHAHAQAQAHGRHSAHQEHHTENDARDGSAPGTHRHTHTLWATRSSVMSGSWPCQLPYRQSAACDATQPGDEWVCDRVCAVCSVMCTRLSESSYVTIKSCVFIGKG